MKILTAALCLVSVGILSGCVDDRGYRSGGYYSSGVYYRSYDRDRSYRDYDRRDRYRRDYDRNDRRSGSFEGRSGGRSNDGWIRRFQ